MERTSMPFSLKCNSFDASEGVDDWWGWGSVNVGQWGRWIAWVAFSAGDILKGCYCNNIIVQW